MTITFSGLQAIEQGQTQFTQASARFTSPAASGDTASLSDSAVSLLSAKNQFETGLDLIKVADKMQKTAIDILG